MRRACANTMVPQPRASQFFSFAALFLFGKEARGLLL